MLRGGSIWVKVVLAPKDAFPVLFVGEFEHTLDQKQRLAIPSELREVLDHKVHGEGFIAAPGPNKCLWLWPEKTFAQLAGALGGSLLGDPGMQDFERAVFSKAARVPLDSAGRVRIPDRLLQKYGLNGAIMVLGVKDHLELVTLHDRRQEEERMEPEIDEIWRRARQALAAQQKAQS